MIETSADPLQRPSAAFQGYSLVAAGPLLDVALTVRLLAQQRPDMPVLVFDDATGAAVDLDLRGPAAAVEARLRQRLTRGLGDPGESRVVPDQAATGADVRRGRPGRPKLGVMAREVTLLPRQWEWLAAQPGGASQALRRLVEAARKADARPGRVRQAREAAYRFMAALAGDLPGFEEASRALFAGDRIRLEALLSAWPPDVAGHVLKLAPGEGPDG